MAHIATNKCGQHVVRNCFNACNIEEKKEVAKLLIQNDSRRKLRNSIPGQKLDYALDLETFKTTPKQWQNQWGTILILYCIMRVGRGKRAKDLFGEMISGGATKKPKVES